MKHDFPDQPNLSYTLKDKEALKAAEEHCINTYTSYTRNVTDQWAFDNDSAPGKKDGYLICAIEEAINALLALKGALNLTTQLKKEEPQEDIKKLLADALYTDGEHHKQWYLWKIAGVLNIDLSDEWDEEYPEPEKGIAP